MARFKIAAIPTAGLLLLAVLAGTVSAADPTPTPRPLHRVAGPAIQFGLVSDAVLQLFGMTREQVQAARQSGKSLAQIAQDKGIGEQQLIDTILGPIKAAISKMVTDGRITQAQADQRVQQMTQRVRTAVERTGVGPMFGNGNGLGIRMNMLSDAVLHLLGMTKEQVQAARQSGKSLAQIAQDKGISEQQLIDTILAPIKAALNQRVAGGKITQAQADTMLTKITQRVKQDVERTNALGAQRTRRNGHRGGVGANVLSDAVLQLLGMTRQEVNAARQSGKSLAQIAQDKGISEQQLIDTIIGPAKAALDKKVAAGTITQAQEDARLAQLTTIVKQAVERTLGASATGQGMRQQGNMHQWDGFNRPQQGQGPKNGPRVAPMRGWGWQTR